MANEFLNKPGEKLLRELMAFAYRDAPDWVPADLPTVQRVDPATLHVLHAFFK